MKTGQALALSFAALFVLTFAKGAALADGVQFAALSERGSAVSLRRSAMPPDPLVRRAQELLTRLGRYVGPVDGLFSQELAEAIAAVTNRAPPTPGSTEPEMLLTQEVVDRISLMVDVDRMQDRLRDAAERQREDARRALDASEDARDLLGRAVFVPIGPDRNPDACFADPGARCLLTEALAAADAVLDRKQRDWAYSEILVAQARAGYLGNALATIGKLGDPRTVMVALRRIAESLARRGDFEIATDIARRVPGVEQQRQALLDIAAAALSHGDQALVAALTAEAEPLGKTEADGAGDILLRAIGLWSAIGKRERADILLSRYVERMPSAGDRRESAILALSERLADSDRAEEAEQWLRRRQNVAGDAVSARIAIALAHARAGDGDRGLSTLSGISQPRYKVVGLARLAAAMASDQAAATAIAEVAEVAAASIELSFARSYAYARLVDCWIALGHIERAEKALDRIADRRLRVTAAWRIVSAGGNGLATRDELVAVAERSLANMSDRLAQVWLLCSLESEFPGARKRLGAEQEFSEEAIDIARTMSDPWFRARAWARISRVFAGDSPDETEPSR
jgi:tetratricopeptide (TPR) repeat protein